MFTIEQLKQLSDFLKQEFKEVFATQEDLKVLDVKIDTLQTSIDGLAKLGAKYTEEIPIMGDRVNNIEVWVKKAAPKIKLEYKSQLC